MQAAVMISHIDWKCQSDKILLDSGIYLENFSKSNVKKLYEKLCSTIEFHDGDPYPFELMILFEENSIQEDFTFWNTPISIISVLCNIISINTGLPLPSYSLITSKDNFKSKWSSPVDINSNYDLFETLTTSSEDHNRIIALLYSINRNVNGTLYVNDDIIVGIKAGIKNLKKFATNTRIQNAFSFYFNAWKSSQLEHLCINLAIVMESLFSPSDNFELTHQLAFNMSHFLGRNNIEKERIYNIIKKFYSLRSKIVHGSTPKFEEMSLFVPVIFVLCSEVLRTLFIDEDLLSIFSDNKKREVLIRKWMFE